ncbi:MAG TPA: glycosyltransferase family 87 protein [Candidatus Binataceae bacterium]|nr:glycosyltransferase family 87 protein [Candidatus Binataceae bacterium]
MTALSAERARRLAWAALAAYIAGLGIAAALRDQGDFRIYYLAGQRVLAGAAIYPPSDSGRFLYAPIFAIGFAPFAMLSRRAAQVAFFAVNAWGLAAFIIGAGVMLFGRARRLSALLIVVPVLLSARFIDNNIEHGQINLPTLALCVWAIVYARERRTIASGAMLAAAALIKPFAILAAMYLLVRKKLAALGWAFVAGVVLLAAPVAVFGLRGWFDQTESYLRAVASMTDRYRLMLTNQSAVAALARVLVRWSPAGDAPRLSLALGMAFECAAIAIVLRMVWRRAPARGDEGAADSVPLAALFCLMPGFAPLSWKSYYAALVVPYMVVIAALQEDWSAQRPPKRSVCALLVLSIILNLASGTYLNRLGLFYSAHLGSSIALLIALLVLDTTADAADRATETVKSRAGAAGS